MSDEVTEKMRAIIAEQAVLDPSEVRDRKSTRLNSSH